MHANKVPAQELGGQAADTFEPFIRDRAAAGERDLLILPLFFGPSRALTELVPAKVAAATADIAPLDARMADVLCPLPGGEPLLAGILRDHLARCAAETGIPIERVVLVDHGSPIPEVTAVRRWLAVALGERLGAGTTLDEAVMERRAGPAYDFNGALLEDVLRRLAEADRERPVFLSMLFMFAGRHAGPGGDVEEIYRAVEAEYPGFRVHQSGLISEHPGLIDILQSRYESAISRG
jgi:sirohydrochlorin ferrochelatase